MILNQQQYRIAKAELTRFEKAIAAARASGCPEDVDPAIHQAMVDGLKSQASELRVQLHRYERLRAGAVKTTNIDSLSEIARAIIEARVAARLTQADLAEWLGVAAQQIQRYEASMYRGVSLERLSLLVELLGIEIPRRLRFGKPRKRKKTSPKPETV